MSESSSFFNPYPGLRPFEPTENHLFFGRDGQSNELLGRLRQTRFLAVVGSSGSGKFLWCEPVYCLIFIAG